MYLGFCGISNSGKTTMICKVIERLKDRRIAVVKHTPHGVDLKSKDSSRFKDAGAGEVVLLDGESIHFRKGESLYGVLRRLNKNYDVVLVEGFKKYKFLPKVCLGMDCESCVFRDPNINEVVEYIEREIAIEKIMNELPNFNCGECEHKNCREMAEAIYRGEDDFKGCRYWNPDAVITVKVNGKEIYMGSFAQDVVVNTITGLLSAFKGVGEIKEVEIRYKVKIKNENLK